MSFKEFFDLKLSPGKVALVWFNSYSGIILKTPRTTLIFDPVMMSLEESIQADGIVITHEHVDHFEPWLAKELQKRTKAPILTTPFIAQTLSRENVKALKVGDSFDINEIRLHAEYCDHAANQPLSFIIAAEGATIYHPSDGHPFPGMAEIREKYKPDLMLYWGTSLDNGVAIAKLIKPRVILSYDHGTGSPRRLSQVAKQVIEAKIQTLKRFEIYQYPP